MTRGPLPEPKDDHDRKVLADVERVGWAVIGIEEDEEGPEYCFSVGLHHTLGGPEILLMGLDFKLAASLVNGIGEAMREGREIKAGERSEEFASVPLEFIAVDAGHYERYVGYACWLNGGTEFPLLQCVWPDKGGRFPWEQGYDADLFERQRLLGPAGEFASGWLFADPPNVATFCVRQVFHGGKPILYVVHDDDDGAWQFLTGEPVAQEDAMVVGLSTVVRHDPSVMELADLPYGWSATRRAVGEPWQREKREGASDEE
jgi:hypothetical protein